MSFPKNCYRIRATVPSFGTHLISELQEFFNITRDIIKADLLHYVTNIKKEYEFMRFSISEIAEDGYDEQFSIIKYFKLDDDNRVIYVKELFNDPQAIIDFADNTIGVTELVDTLAEVLYRYISIPPKLLLFVEYLNENEYYTMFPWETLSEYFIRHHHILDRYHLTSK